MVKVILTHLGCFDPKSLPTDPLHESSKLILSLPTTTPLLRVRVRAKALPSCQSCWQPAELKAVSNADDQCKWLSANGLHSHFFLCVGMGGPFHTTYLFLFSFEKIMKFANDPVCSCTLLAFAETEWQPVLCDSPFKVSLTVILALFWGSELARIRNGTSQQLRGDSSKALSQRRHRGTGMWLKN